MLIFDEPTSVLIEKEDESLLKINDEVTVLRAGKTVAHGVTETLNAELLVQMMVCKHIPLDVRKKPQQACDIVMQVKNLNIKNDLIHTLKDVSFDLCAGEIVAVAGISGNGQQEMIETIMVFREPSSGQIIIEGSEVTSLTTRQRRQMGLSFIPEDRIHVGSCATATLGENMIVNRYYEVPLARRGWRKIKAMYDLSSELISEFKIKVANADTMMGTLSGGNIQKSIIARELSVDPKILVACEIAMGLDVESSRYVYDMLLGMREAQKAILLVSSDINEVMSLADRILVIHEGRIVAHFPDCESFSKGELGEYMLGIKEQDYVQSVVS